MDKKLRVVAGPDKGNYFLLPPAGIQNIGKVRQHNEICLHDQKLSRVHSQVEVDGDKVILTDLDSETGTFVNGERVSSAHELHHGDVINCGDTQLCFQAVDENRPKSAAEIRVAPIAEAKKAAPASAPVTPSAPAGMLTKELPALAGTTLARYELQKVIGKGHTSLVFRARDTKDDRIVAVRVFPGDFPKTDEENQRFVDAIKLTIPVRHPNLVTVFGAGRTGAHCWLAMEFVEGESLFQLLQRPAVGAPDWRSAFRLAVHVGRALHAAHQQQLIHRNVTPANILYRSTDQLFKLNDLMLTRALAGSALRQAVLRAKVASEATSLAPEQTYPAPTLDTRCDLFSLGVVVYQLLTGRPPFAGKTPQETVAQLREAAPIPPRELVSAVPERFETAILKLLAKKPEERFQTPAELLTELCRVAPDAT